MKGKYRKLIPIALIVLMIAACYSIVSQASKKNAEYKAHINAARKAAKDSITVDVQSEYLKAIDMKPSLDLYLELGEYYTNNELYDLGKDLGLVMIEKYPHESKSFEYLLTNCLKINDYEEFFDEYNHAKKLGVINKNIEKLYSQSEYIYKIDFNSYLTAGIFSTNLCPVSLEDYTEGKVLFGFANEEGELGIEAKFKECGYFNSDEVAVAPVVDTEGNAFYVDKEGNKKIVINPKNIKVVKLGMLSSAVLTVFDGTNYYLCDKESNVLAGPYKYISTVNGDIGVIQDNDGWKMINSKGKIISKNVYEGFALDEKEIAFRQDVLIAKKNGKYSLISKDEKVISNQEFEDAKMFVDSFAAVKIGSKWGFIDASGKVVIEAKYEDAKSFSNGLAPVCDGLWGYISFKDNAVTNAIDCVFTDANNFSQTKKCAFVKTDDVWKMLILYSELKG